MFAEALEAKGDFEQALIHWKVASNIKEEMLGAEKQRAITSIQIRSATEKLEKERTLLRKGMKLKSQEIERMAMDLTERNELIRNTSRRVKEVVKLTRDGHTTRSKLDELLSDLSYTLEEKKAVLPNEFQLLHRDMLQKLSIDYPALSLTERKVCVLLREALSTKQIANILKISTRTVDGHRNKIRKKMNLGAGVSLTTLLAGM